MGRPRTISDDAILDAARQVFMRDGGHATTAEVARTAGVSEGTIFKRFATKEELFRSAFECGQAWTRDLAARAGHGEIRTQLADIVRDLLTMFRFVLPRVMMQMGHAGMEPAALFAGKQEAPPVRGLRILTEWFEAEMKLGRLRQVEPKLAARMLLGAVHNVVFHEMIAPSANPPAQGDELPLGLADLLLDGLRPEATVAEPTRARRVRRGAI